MLPESLINTLTAYVGHHVTCHELDNHHVGQQDWKPLNRQALFSVCGELTALLDFVSVGRGFSFIQTTRRSPSTSNIPYLWVSIKTRTEPTTVNSFCKVKIEAWLLYKLTLVFALVRQDQAAVLTLRLVARKRLFDFTEAEIFFEQGVTVDGKEALSSQLKQHLCASYWSC